MKIQTTEAVRRFNAQIELTDYALGLAAVDVSDVRKLASLLSIAGHHDLRLTLLQSAAELGQPGQPPDKTAATPTTKSACQHNNMVLNDSKEFAWKCADCGYVYGMNDTQDLKVIASANDPVSNLAQEIVEEMEREICHRDTVWHDIGLIATVEDMIRKNENWREFCKHSSRPGDVANVILQRDRLLNVVRLCVARLEEYGDAEGGTALELARRELR